MKRLLIFILPILIIITVTLAVFGITQVRLEENRLIDEIKRKAGAVADSIEMSARHILIENDTKNANRLVEKFQRRERLQGCVIYDKDGNVFSVTPRFSEWRGRDKPYIDEILADKKTRSSVETFKGYKVFSYTLPILDEDGTVLGLVEIIYDTSYIFIQLSEIWRLLSITLIILVILIVLIALFIQRQIFTLPVERLTEWFRHYQRGEADLRHPIKDKGELGKLAREIEQVALGLKVARKAASEEAQVRINKGDSWTEERLKDTVKAKLGEKALFVVSNREPYMHVVDTLFAPPKCIRPASGVVTAIDPIMRACGGTWVAHGGGNADKRFVNSTDKLGVPPKEDRYILKRTWLTKEEEDGYYYGFSNEGLWPLCHITYTRPIFRESDWQMYKKVNQKFADSILAELPSGHALIFIQDYHFTLLPQMIKEKRPDVLVALFWHIPWPNAEIFSICPYQKEILNGMLGCDLLGFHVQYHCNNFLDTVNRLLEARVDMEKFSVVRADKETFVRAFPISIDGYSNNKPSATEKDETERIVKEFELEGKTVAIGVDRIDYTKGIIERLMAIDKFFDKYPQYRGKFVFIQLAAPSRVHIKRYHDLMGEIDELVEKVNWKYSDGTWSPIRYLKKHFSPEEIVPFYRIADICIVSSLHDGMNLVAKEYIMSRLDSKGVLILSRFTGAARELTDAIIVNPYSIGECADSIKQAVDMPDDEKVKRMEHMKSIISENNIYKWAGNIITELAALKKI